MTLVVPFFSAHQPFALRSPEARRSACVTGPADLEGLYFDDAVSRSLFLQAADRCYRPATRLIRDLVQRNAGEDKPFRVTYGLSGTLLALAERYAPDLLDLWRDLAQTGLVEFTGQTFFHSLAGLLGDGLGEFRSQVNRHSDAITERFGRPPAVFCNTGMLYNNGIAACVQEMGFQGMLTEGVDWLTAGWRSPNRVYAGPSGLPVLLRNYRLSDDIGYRFTDKTWDGYPLTADKFAGWLADHTEPVILLALDYETLGEYNRADSGIFEFVAALPGEVARFPHMEWATPSQALAQVPAADQIDVPSYSTISWADRERDTSAWLGNEMQQYCFEEIRHLEPAVRATGDPHILHVWRLLQTSDYLHIISDKAAGDAHGHGPGRRSVVEAFIQLHTAVFDLKRRIEHMEQEQKDVGPA